VTTLAGMIAKRYGETAGPDGPPPPNGTVAGLLERRSLRAYTDAPVPDELLRTLLACAQSAPTKSNLQQYSIVAVKDPAQRARLAPLCKRTSQIESAPLLLVFCADARRGRRICEMRGHPHANDNMDTLLNAAVDAALALGFFVVAAEAAGLRCAPLSSLRDEIEGVADVLGLPDGVFPVAGLMAGWPAAEGYVNQRLPQSVVVHTDRYDDSALEAEIDAYDRRRHAIFPQPPERQRHPDRFGHADPYYWSEGAARQFALPERAQLRDFLLRHGFALE
jgi:nitroreductase/FMN reductase [NAD(P)H]